MTIAYCAHMLDELLSGNLEHHFGSAKALLGTMATGKSTIALVILTVFKQFANQLNCKIDIFRPSLDTRTQISRLGIDRGSSFVGINTVYVNTAKEITDYVDSKARFGKRRVLLFDEPEFLDSAFIKVVEKLCSQGHLPILSMLDKNFRGEPFAFKDYEATTDDLLTKIPDANKCYLKWAKCCICQETADYSQRLINGQPAPYYDPLHMIDSDTARQQANKNYTYEPRCKDHFTVPWKEESYALETMIKLNPGMTKKQAIEIANDALKIPTDVTAQTIEMFVTEKRVREEEGKLYPPPKIIIATQIPRQNT